MDARQFNGSDDRDVFDAIEPCEDCGQAVCCCARCRDCQAEGRRKFVTVDGESYGYCPRCFARRVSVGTLTEAGR